MRPILLCGDPGRLSAEVRPRWLAAERAQLIAEPHGSRRCDIRSGGDGVAREVHPEKECRPTVAPPAICAHPVPNHGIAVVGIGMGAGHGAGWLRPGPICCAPEAAAE